MISTCITIDGRKFHSARGMRTASALIRERYADAETVGAMMRLHKIKEVHRVNGVKYFDLAEVEQKVRGMRTRSEAMKERMARKKSRLDQIDKDPHGVANVYLLLSEVSAKLDRLMGKFGIQ